MNRKYSLKSLVFSNLPGCFETISKYFKYKDIEILKGDSQKRYETHYLEALKELDDRHFPVKVSFIRDEGTAYVKFSDFWTILNVDIEGFDEKHTNQLYETIEKELGLQQPTEEERRGVATFPNMMSLLWKVYDKIESLTKYIEKWEGYPKRQLRCFVSFRFDDHSKALAFELREFLELVGVDFVSGLGYEPRSISEKVLEKLTDPLDIFMVIYSSTGDSAWLNQEIGVARARNLPILVLREESSKSDLGMLGDAEYLLFPDKNINKAFVGILQAISYIERRRNKT